jgi:hypothetical protein
MKKVIKNLIIYSCILFQSHSIWAKSNEIIYFQILFEKNKAILTKIGDSALQILIDDLKQFNYKNVILVDGNNYFEAIINRDISFKRIQLILDSLKAYEIELNRVYVDLYSQKRNNHMHGIGFSLTSRTTIFEIKDTLIFNSKHFSPDRILLKSKSTIGEFIKTNYSDFEFNHSIVISLCSDESLKERILKSYKIKKKIAKAYKIPERRISIICDNPRDEINKIFLIAW